MGLWTKGMGVILRNKASKKIFKEASGGLQHPVINKFKLKKNLTKRKKDQQDMFKVVDAQYTKAGVKPGIGAAKIKKDAAKKVSDIHDKYDAKK
tara:strand:+ start:37 stop:318 length:282 start_codon:yes stop_codon:yes gene_type:complete